MKKTILLALILLTLLSAASTVFSQATLIVETVGDRDISANEFQQMVIFLRYQFRDMYLYDAFLTTQGNSDIEDVNKFWENILGINGREDIGKNVLDRLSHAAILDMEAQKAGLIFTEEKITDELQTLLGYDSDSAGESFDKYLDRLLKETYEGHIERDFLYSYARQSLEDKALYEAYVDSLHFEDEYIEVRHILVSKEDTAKEVLSHLFVGEDWDELAKEYSEDYSNAEYGGNLGWVTKGTFMKAFDDAAFGQEVGAYTKSPVKTEIGWHIIKVTGREMRPLSKDETAAKWEAQYSTWLNTLHKEYTAEVYDTWRPAYPLTPAWEPVTDKWLAQYRSK